PRGNPKVRSRPHAGPRGNPRVQLRPRARAYPRVQPGESGHHHPCCRPRASHSPFARNRPSPVGFPRGGNIKPPNEGQNTAFTRRTPPPSRSGTPSSSLPHPLRPPARASANGVKGPPPPCIGGGGPFTPDIRVYGNLASPSRHLRHRST